MADIKRSASSSHTSHRCNSSGLPTLNEDQIAERGARLARRDDREYREYLREEQRRQAGCPAREVVLVQRGQATRRGWLEGSMLRGLWILIAGCLAILSAASGLVQAAGPQQPPSGAATPSVTPQRALLNQYCVSCHNQKLKTAGLALDAVDVANVGDKAEVWEKVVRKVRGGLMPPAGRPRPDKPTHDGFAAWLETELDRAAARHPNPG